MRLMEVERVERVERVYINPLNFINLKKSGYLVGKFDAPR